MKQTFAVILFVAFFTSCFGLKYFPSSGISALYIILILLGLIWGYRNAFVFRKPLLVFFTFMVISMVSCYIIRGQSIISTLAVETNLLAILLVFPLLNLNYRLRNIEKAIAILSIYFCVIYLIQNIAYPQSIYVYIDTENVRLTDEVSARLRFIGQGIGSLGYFMFVNKYLESKSNKYIIYALLCFTFIVLMAFRMMIVAAIISTFYIYAQYNRINLIKVFKFAVSIFLLFISLYYLIPQSQTYFSYLFERFSEVSEINESYIRFITLDYYLNDFFIHPLEYLFGAGFPNYKEQGYSTHILQNIQNGIYWDDWGLIGLSWMIGPITVLSLIYISFKAIFLKVERKYKYFAAWYIFLLLISFLNTEFYRTGNPAIHALVLYCLTLANRHYENRNINISSCN